MAAGAHAVCASAAFFPFPGVGANARFLRQGAGAAPSRCQERANRAASLSILVARSRAQARATLPERNQRKVLIGRLSVDGSPTGSRTVTDYDL